MIEIPEASVLAKQLRSAVSGRKVGRVTAAQSPHKFAWYSGDPAGYAGLLAGKTIGSAICRAGMVEIQAEGMVLLFSDGVNLRFHENPAGQPLKHQLLVEFDDGCSLSATVAMYGGILCFPDGTNDNPYYRAARDKPSPLTGVFDGSYFAGLMRPEWQKLPLKGFLATEQRIPGLGNGVLQDILFNARLHPKRKLSALSADEKENLFRAVKTTLAQMEAGGGRDTELDLSGSPGGYRTRMSRNTAGKPCAVCGSPVQKQAYMGGSIYFCPGCQAE